jgi:two-component system sensor histidine kinase VicK
MKAGQETLFQTIFNSLTEPRIVVKADSPDFTIVACNSAYHKVSNTVGQDIINKKMGDLHQLNRDNINSDLIIRNALHKAISEKTVVKLNAVRYDIPQLDSSIIDVAWWQAEYVPILGNDGCVDFLMCTIHNITEQVINQESVLKVRQQEEALEYERALNEKLEVNNEQLQTVNHALQTAQEKLEKLNLQLEERVDLRTKALTESETRFRYLIQHAPVAIGIINGNNLVLESANEAMLQLIGKTEAVIGKTFAEALPELKEQQFHQLLHDVFKNGKRYNGNEVRVELEYNGKLRESYFNFIYQPLKNENKETTNIIAVATDVTGQVNARQELEKAHDSLALAIDAAGIGTWNASLSTRFLSASEQTRMILGVPDKIDLTLDEAIKVIYPEYRTKVSNAFREAVQDKKEFKAECLINPINGGKPRWIVANGKVYYNSRGLPSYITGAILDITEQKQDDIRKNDFIAIVSHELKTPLTSLKAYVQMLTVKAKKADDVFTAVALEKVNAQVKKMTNLINSFLNVSRLEAGKVQLEKTSFTLNKLLEDVLEENKHILNRRQVHMVPCDAVTVFADYEKIGSVISNLLSNADKYSPNAAPISLNCSIKNNEVQVSVTDKGMGINPKDIDKLFDRFFRVTDPNTKHISGFGIGLYLSSEIIRQHHGKIWVESEIGKGSTFHFSLPMV